MPDQATGPGRGGRHGSRPGPDEGREHEALAQETGERGRRGRRGRPEQPAPRNMAPLGRDVVLPRRDAPPGRDETVRGPGQGRPGGRRRPPGWDEAATAVGTLDGAAPPREYAGEDVAPPDRGRSRRRGAQRQAAADSAVTEDRPGRGSRAARYGARSGKRRVRVLLIGVVAVVVVAAAAVAALKFVSGGSGESHVLVAPSRLASYVRRPQLEQQMNAKALQEQVIAKSAGQASHVVSAVYENSAGLSGTVPPQIFLFIGGNLAGVSPAGFISSFTAQFKGASATTPGSLGGQAACVNARGSATGSVALCTWADGDTFGVMASPTMSLSQLAAQMRAIRPSVERPAK
jgi:hypothetical protein